MQGNPQIIAELNKLLKNELTAINQYFLHARMMEHWGFERLGKKIYEELIGEMKHADKLIKRILLLDGLPNLQDLGRLGVGETVSNACRPICELENEARTALVAAVTLCETTKDLSAARSSSTSWRMPRSTSISSRPRCAGRQGRRAELPADADRRGQGARAESRVTREARQVSSEEIRRRGLLVGPGLRDALAHVAGAAAALGALAAGAEDIGGAAGAGPDGGVDFAFTDGPADADEHALAPRFLCRCDLLAGAKIEAGAGPVKRQLKPWQQILFQLCPQLARRSDGASCP